MGYHNERVSDDAEAGEDGGQLCGYFSSAVVFASKVVVVRHSVRAKPRVPVRAVSYRRGVCRVAVGAACVHGEDGR